MVLNLREHTHDARERLLVLAEQLAHVSDLLEDVVRRCARPMHESNRKELVASNRTHKVLSRDGGTYQRAR